MYEASRQPALMRSGNALQNITTDHAILVADSELHMSPIGLEPEGMGMVGMLDQQGLWDLDGMYWSQGSDQVDFAPYSVNEGMMPVEYGLMAGHMDGAYFVH